MRLKDYDKESATIEKRECAQMERAVERARREGERAIIQVRKAKDALDKAEALMDLEWNLYPETLHAFIVDAASLLPDCTVPGCTTLVSESRTNVSSGC